MVDGRTSIRIRNAMPMINEFPPANVFCLALIEIIIIIIMVVAIIIVFIKMALHEFDVQMKEFSSTDN